MPLDWRVFCQLYRQTDDPMWGVFPHPSAGSIAKSIGVTRVTVWRRLTAMQRAGFLTGYEVIPNPILLGVGLSHYNIMITDPRARLRFLDELEFVDGAFLATIDFGPGASLIAISDFPSSRHRREKMIARIDGVESLSPPTPVWLPDCGYKVSRDGWRFIDAARRNPTWSLDRIARELRTTPGTVSIRYQMLKRERAILGHPLEDFAKLPGTVIGVDLTLEPGVDSRLVARAVRLSQPDALEAPSPLRRAGTPSSGLTFIQLCRNASETNQCSIEFLAIRGVEKIDTFFPGMIRAYRHWFDARMFEVMARFRT